MYNDATAPAFSVVEVWDDFDINNPDAHRQKLCDYIDSVGGNGRSAFDFTTKAVLQQAVGAGEYWRLKDAQGKPAGLIGWWPTKAVTFLDNHDTGASTGGTGENMWPFPSDHIMEGYAYILTHPGVPCVYWPHFFDWGLHDQIKALIQLRKSAGINSASQVSVQAAPAATRPSWTASSRSRSAPRTGARARAGPWPPPARTTRPGPSKLPSVVIEWN